MSPPPVPSPQIARPDHASAASIKASVAALARLGSYRFSVDVVGRDALLLQRSTVDVALRGTLRRDGGFMVDALIGTRLREPDGSAAVSAGSRLVLGTDYAWQLDDVSEDLEPIPLGSAETDFTLVLPEGIAARLVVPFGAGYRRVGTVRRDGVEAVHYQATSDGLAAYATTLAFGGEVTADLWIASRVGHLIAARLGGTSSSNDGFLFEIAIEDPDDSANVVDLPVPPVPDPVRPSEPPVDLRLEYHVDPAAGDVPTATDVEAIGVALRNRLDISARPVSVEVSGARIVVIVCGTTRPTNDRKLVEAIGALTVVGLPTVEYGTSSRPGPMALPAAGTAIDPALLAIAPPARLGSTTAHVDPATGRRGLAFTLSNQPAEAFRTHAAAHPGEIVAVVLDGIVLATLAIDDRLARGHFVFTGDYTETESRDLARWLYHDPLPFALRLVNELEQPAAGR